MDRGGACRPDYAGLPCPRGRPGQSLALDSSGPMPRAESDPNDPLARRNRALTWMRRISRDSGLDEADADQFLRLFDADDASSNPSEVRFARALDILTDFQKLRLAEWNSANNDDERGYRQMKTDAASQRLDDKFLEELEDEAWLEKYIPIPSSIGTVSGGLPGLGKRR